jgi:hypothetical protein
MSVKFSFLDFGHLSTFTDTFSPQNMGRRKIKIKKITDERNRQVSPFDVVRHGSPFKLLFKGHILKEEAGVNEESVRAECPLQLRHCLDLLHPEQQIGAILQYGRRKDSFKVHRGKVSFIAISPKLTLASALDSRAARSTHQ